MPRNMSKPPSVIASGSKFITPKLMLMRASNIKKSWKPLIHTLPMTATIETGPEKASTLTWPWNMRLK